MDEQMVSTFMEVTSCESQADAVRYLGSCRWNLNEAINLYFSNPGGSTEPPPSGSSADPILPEENVPMPTKEYNDDHGGDAIYGDYEDDVWAPQYYDDRSAAVDVPSLSLSLSEIVPTGWPGEEAETGDAAGEAGVENVVDGNQQEAAHDDDAEHDDDNNSTKEDDGGSNDIEDYDNNMMSYSEEDDDDDAAYFATLAEETDGAGRPAVQPPSEKESLEELFQPPYELMYRGSFHDAKVHAARHDKFLLVNLQTSSGAGEFPSHMQNRDLWPDELVREAVEDGFVFFWLRTMPETTENSDSYVDQCAKVAGFYNLVDGQLPALLVLDPITGQLRAMRSGAMTPDEFVQFVDEYTKSSPSALSILPKFVEKTPPPVLPDEPVGEGGEQKLAWGSFAAAVKQEPPAAVSESPSPAEDEAVEQEQEIAKDFSAAAGGDCSEQEPVPVPNDDNTNDELPAEMVDVVEDDDEEPMEGEEMYKLRIRFPDGTMVAKEFGCKRRVASLFAFCRSALRGGGQHAEEEEEEEEKKEIRIMRFAGRALVAMQDDDAGATFEDLGLNLEAVSVVFDV